MFSQRVDHNIFLFPQCWPCWISNQHKKYINFVHCHHVMTVPIKFAFKRFNVSEKKILKTFLPIILCLNYDLWWQASLISDLYKKFEPWVGTNKEHLSQVFVYWLKRKRLVKYFPIWEREYHIRFIVEFEEQFQAFYNLKISYVLWPTTFWNSTPIQNDIWARDLLTFTNFEIAENTLHLFNCKKYKIFIFQKYASTSRPKIL